MLTDVQWSVLGPLVEACRPKGKTPPQDLRRTIEAILWRHQNGAKWRAVPSKAAKDAVSRARSGGGSGAKEAVEKLADAINAIIAHLEKQSGGGMGNAPEENDLDVSGEPRQFD